MTKPTTQPTGSGRYPRGEETKQRIVDAAIEAFGRHGYVGCSTRNIAAAAAVNTPAISYYFGSKLGLYSACLDRLTAGVSHQITPAVEKCQAAIARKATLEEIIALLGEVQNRLIDAFFSDHEGHAIRRLLAWEDAENGEPTSDQFMKTRIGLPILQTFRDVVAHIIAAPAEPIEIEMHALSLMGLSMIFHFNQSRVMDMLNWTELDDRLLDALKGVARQQLEFALTGLSSPDLAR